jgi:hypothetical protein
MEEDDMKIRPAGRGRPIHWVRMAWRPKRRRPPGDATVSFGWNLNFADEEEADVTVTATVEPIVEATYDDPASGGAVYIDKIVRNSTGEEVDEDALPEGELESLQDRAREEASEKEEGLEDEAADIEFERRRDRTLFGD